MLYQEMLVGKTPYRMFIKKGEPFQKHAHLEVEIMYCIDGETKASVSGKTYTIKRGEVLFVSSMTPHEMIKCDGKSKVLVLEMGPTLLRGYFKKISVISDGNPIIDTNDNDTLRSVFDEAVKFCESGEEEEMLAVAQIYKVCGTLTSVVALKQKEKAESLINDTQRIEKALQLIYGQYTLPVTVDDAADFTGYGKSNFCKIFKRTYGESFHKMLNRHRIENAYYFLSETDMSVEEIAQSVGFDDVKTFYRVFKSVTGITPKEFKNSAHCCR